MQNAILNLMGMNGIQGNTGISGLTGTAPVDGGVSFQEVLKAIGGNTSAASEMTPLIQADGTEQTAVMTELTFNEKLDALLEKAEELSSELAEAVKQVIFAAAGFSGCSQETVTSNINNILSGLTADEQAQVLSYIKDFFAIVKIDAESTETDSGNIFEAVGSIFEKLAEVTEADDDESQDSNADVTDSAAEMLAAMVQNYCADNTEVVQAVQDMANGNAEISEIVSYLEKSGVSDDIVKQFAQTADEFIISQNNGKAPFELLSYRTDSVQSSITAASVRTVTVSDELKQLLNQNSDNDNLSKNNEAADFMSMLAQNASQTGAPVQTEQTTKTDVPFTQVSNQIIENLSAKLFEASQSDMTSEMKILLNPQDLGEVAVKLVSENGSVSVMMSAANSQVAKMLAENLPALMAALENQNVTVKDVTVIDPSDAASQMGFAFTSQNNGSERDSSTDSHRRVNGVFSLEPNKIETDLDVLQTNVYENNPKGAKLWATA